MYYPGNLVSISPYVLEFGPYIVNMGKHAFEGGAYVMPESSIRCGKGISFVHSLTNQVDSVFGKSTVLAFEV